MQDYKSQICSQNNLDRLTICNAELDRLCRSLQYLWSLDSRCQHGKPDAELLESPVPPIVQCHMLGTAVGLATAAKHPGAESLIV